MEKFPAPDGAYGASKTAAAFLTRKIHFEAADIKLTAFVISPGWVQTDMGNAGAVANGLQEAPTSLEDSIKGLVEKVTHATRENSGGKFLAFDGEAWAW